MSATEKSKPEIVRKRKPAARRSDIVIALLEERIGMLPVTSDSEPHLERLADLFDELRRSLGKKDDSAEE